MMVGGSPKFWKAVAFLGRVGASGYNAPPTRYQYRAR